MTTTATTKATGILQPYSTGSKQIGISSSQGGGEISGSNISTMQMQAAIASALAPYLKQMQALSDQANNPKSQYNQELAIDNSMIQNPQWRKEAQGSESAMAKQLAAFPTAFAEQNKYGPLSNLYDTLLNSAVSRLTYYGTAADLPAVYQNPQLLALGNLIDALGTNAIAGKIPVNQYNPNAYQNISPYNTGGPTTSTTTSPLASQASTPRLGPMSNGIPPEYGSSIPGWQAIVNLFNQPPKSSPLSGAGLK